MKQKIHGKKVQNWHRPLGKDELKHRYIQIRHDHVEVPEDLDWGQDGEPLDSVSDAMSARYDVDGGYYPTAEEYRAENFLAELEHIHYPFRNLPGTGEAEKSHPAVGVCLQGTTAEPVESRLHGYYQRLNQEAAWDGVLADIQDRLVSPRDLKTIRKWCRVPGGEDAVKNILLLSPFWLRFPGSFAGVGFHAFVGHLFVEFEVPRFLTHCWCYPAKSSESHGMLWAIILGQGGSLKRAGHLFGWAVPRKLNRNLYEVSPDVGGFRLGLTEAEVRRLGGSPRDAARVCGSTAFILDPVEEVGNHRRAEGWFTYDSRTQVRDRRAWGESVQWLIRHGDDLDDRQACKILNWCGHMWTEEQGQESGRVGFSLQGRSVARVLERAEEYEDRVGFRRWGRYRAWEQNDLDLAFTQDSVEWEFIELIDSKELGQEGKAMHHCVGDYAGRCVSGHSAIVSIRRNGERHLTLQCRPGNAALLQVRGMNNSDPMGEDLEIIHTWRKQILYRKGN